MANEQCKVIAGIDTHAHTHRVVLVTEYGKRLGDQKFLAVGSGYREIAAYLTSFGPVTAVGVEGTGSYGAELARVLAGQGFTVLEVIRPNRAERRLRGKSDPLDAYQAAESVLADRGTSTPKTRDGYVEALRVLRTARTSAMKARTALLNQISGILTSATDEVRAKYRGLKSEARAKAMAASRPTGDPADPVVADPPDAQASGCPASVPERGNRRDRRRAGSHRFHLRSGDPGGQRRGCRGRVPAVGDLRRQPRTHGQ
jgi:transposase